MRSYLVFFLLFFLPLFVIPVTISPFEVPKVILAEILIEILLFLFIVRAKREPFLSSAKGGFIKYYLLFALFLLSLINLILHQTQTTFFGNAFRHQGVFLLWHLLIFSFLSKDIKLDQIPKFLFPLSLLGLFIGTVILGGNEAGRFYGTLGEPNALAATAIFIWPFAYFVIPARFAEASARRAKAGIHLNTLAKLSAPLMALIIILLSSSRSGLLAFTIQCIFLILTRMTNFAIAKSVILSIILIAFSLFLPILEGGGWFENRFEVWSTSLSAGNISPVIGSGFGNMEYTLKETSRLINNNIQYQYVDSTHNFILDYFVQGGVLGTGLILSTIILSLLGLTRKKDRLLLSSFLGVLTVMSFNPVSVVTLLAFWYLIGRGFGADLN